jgi:sphinganine-1-phosphate aldolase
VTAVDGLRLLPGDSTVVAFASQDPALDLFVLADELAALGWHTQPQFHHGELPTSIHLTVTAAVAPGVDDFAGDLAKAVDRARELGPVHPPEVAFSPSMLTPEAVAGLAGALGFDLGSPAALPTRMAPVNALLDAAPPVVRERLLAAFLGLLQRPSW